MHRERPPISVIAHLVHRGEVQQHPYRRIGGEVLEQCPPLRAAIRRPVRTASDTARTT
ncbi:hypothetical protein [Nonomuraea sp. NPDC050786]|uniref:hypothetical protein n=1 Tax=Nonomuraea sp. NPDC050786 TaxID=3154840 RepID=UPI0034108E11